MLTFNPRENVTIKVYPSGLRPGRAISLSAMAVLIPSLKEAYSGTPGCIGFSGRFKPTLPPRSTSMPTERRLMGGRMRARISINLKS